MEETPDKELPMSETVEAGRKEEFSMDMDVPEIEEHLEEVEEAMASAQQESLLSDDIVNPDNAIDLQSLIDHLKVLIASDDIEQVKPEILKLKGIFDQLLMEKRQQLVLDGENHKDDQAAASIIAFEDSFHHVWSVFKERRKLFMVEMEKQKVINFEKKQTLLDDLKKLIESDETLKTTFDEFKKIQDSWKEIGQVPKDKSNDLWMNYNLYVERFLDKVRINKELRDLDLKKNLDLKLQLCEQVEALLLDKPSVQSFKKLQDYHQKWRETGPVPSEKRDEVWDRFRLASEKIRESRMEHYQEIREQLEKNYESKQALLDKARMLAESEIATTADWVEKTKEVNELFKIWRTIGPAPKKVNDEIWMGFKTILDSFFAMRKEHYNVIRQEYSDNYNQKVNLCLQAEAIQDSTDWKKASEELIRLQKEWKQIGPISRKQSDLIWKRFRTACDSFFNRKNEHFAGLTEKEQANLQLKQALIEELDKQVFTDDKTKNLEIIQAYQKRWFDIGRVPLDKRDVIQKQFRDKVDSILEQLKISRFESEERNSKARYDQMSSSHEGKLEMTYELKQLSIKISKQEENIRLWENNIGFFSASKNAEVLLKEFNEKIEKAKVEVKVLKEKQKYLRNMIDA